VGVLLLEKK